MNNIFLYGMVALIVLAFGIGWKVRGLACEVEYYQQREIDLAASRKLETQLAVMQEQLKYARSKNMEDADRWLAKGSLSPDCVLDSDGLRILNEAITSGSGLYPLSESASPQRSYDGGPVSELRGLSARLR